MIRWLRVVSPPGWTLVLAALIHFAFQALYFWLEWKLGTPFFSFVNDQEILIVLMGLWALGYAVYRVWAFHPALRPGYFQWLNGTPWTSRKPLPLGPIHLVWQDVLLVGIVVGLNWPRLWLQSLAAAQVFLFGYLTFLSVVNYFTEAKAWAYASGFALGIMGLSAREPVLFFSAAAATYGIAFLGMRSSLALFPWERSLLKRNLAEMIGNRSLGWPHDHLGPRSPGANEMSLADVMGIGLLAGWWLFVVNCQFRWGPGYDRGFLVCSLFLSIGAGSRTLIYCIGYWPPLSLLGRLIHGRWIIPGYDKVFLAPLLALLVGTCMTAGLLAVRHGYVPNWTGLEAELITPLALTMGFWILFGMGPSLKEWRLTGNHRIAPIFSSQVHTR